MFNIAVDIGFSNIKSAIEAEGLGLFRSVFSTALAIAPTSANNDAVIATESYLYDGITYLCGYKAKSTHVQDQINCHSNEHLIKYAPVYIAAIAQYVGCVFGDIGILSVGLPFEMYQPYSQALRNVLTSFTVNDTNLTPTQLNIFCQGAGAAFAAGVELEIMGNNSLLIDIGRSSVTLVAVKNHIPVALGSRQYFALGMMSAVEQLARSLSSGTDKCQIKAAEEIIAHTYPGQYDSAQVDRVLTNQANSIIATLENAYGAQINKMDNILLTGGGASCIYPYLPNNWRKRVRIQAEPLTANARGYFYRSKGLIGGAA